MPRGSKMVDIEARYDSIIAEFTPDLVCIDYLGIMKPNHESNQDWLDVGKVAEEMHEFCRSKDIPVLTAAQRKNRDKKNKSQSHDGEDIGRSRLILDNCNIMLLIETRDEEHLLEDMNVHIVKNRDGEKGKVTLMKVFEKSTITSMPLGWAGNDGDENEA
jgi:replicative DNA helicase